MKLYEISQLPVMDGDRIVGILDESDVLLHVYGDEARFRDPVSTATVSKLEVMDVESPIEALLPVFVRGQVALDTNRDHFTTEESREGNEEVTQCRSWEAKEKSKNKKTK